MHKYIFREIAEEGKDKTENEKVVYCPFTDANGLNCGAEAHAGSPHCEVHVELPTTSRTGSGTGKRRAKKVKKQQPIRKKRMMR